jgi:hypothetical protein
MYRRRAGVDRIIREGEYSNERHTNRGFMSLLLGKNPEKHDSLPTQVVSIASVVVEA